MNNLKCLHLDIRNGFSDEHLEVIRESGRSAYIIKPNKSEHSMIFKKEIGTCKADRLWGNFSTFYIEGNEEQAKNQILTALKESEQILSKHKDLVKHYIEQIQNENQSINTPKTDFEKGELKIGVKLKSIDNSCHFYGQIGKVFNIDNEKIDIMFDGGLIATFLKFIKLGETHLVVPEKSKRGIYYMKTKEEIIRQEPIYLNDWEKNKKTGVVADFEGIWVENKKEMQESLNKYRDINILFASYGYENYTGDAFVLFEKDGELFEVNGSHCSCYGLEGQWTPEEVSLLELENRLVNGTFGEDDWSGNSFKEELCKFLGIEFIENLHD